METKMPSSAVRADFGAVHDRAIAGETIVVTRHGRPTVVILEHGRYRRLVDDNPSTPIREIVSVADISNDMMGVITAGIDALPHDGRDDEY